VKVANVRGNPRRSFLSCFQRMESMINYPRFMRLVAASLIALLLLAAQTLAAFTNPFNVANGNLLALDENGSNEITRTYDGLNRLGWSQSSANTGWEHDLSRSLATIPRDIAVAAGVSAAFQSIGSVVRSAITAAKATVRAESKMVTVLGSGRDVSAYAGKSGFNVLDMSKVPEAEWARKNAEWLNSALRRGDDIWLVTDPAKHTQLMQQLGKQSYYLDLELPMLEQFGANTIPKFVP